MTIHSFIILFHNLKKPLFLSIFISIIIDTYELRLINSKVFILHFIPIDLASKRLSIRYLHLSESLRFQYIMKTQIFILLIQTLMIHLLFLISIILTITSICITNLYIVVFIFNILTHHFLSL